MLVTCSHLRLHQRTAYFKLILYRTCRRGDNAQGMGIGAVITPENGDNADKLAVCIENRRPAAGRAVVKTYILLRAEHLHGLFVKSHTSRHIVAGILFRPAGADKSPGGADQLLFFSITQKSQHMDLTIQKAQQKARTFKKTVEIFHERIGDIDQFFVACQQIVELITFQDLVLRPGQRLQPQLCATHPGFINLLRNDGTIHLSIAGNELLPFLVCLLVKSLIVFQPHQIDVPELPPFCNGCRIRHFHVPPFSNRPGLSLIFISDNLPMQILHGKYRLSCRLSYFALPATECIITVLFVSH